MKKKIKTFSGEKTNTKTETKTKKQKGFLLIDLVLNEWLEKFSNQEKVREEALEHQEGKKNTVRKIWEAIFLLF